MHSMHGCESPSPTVTNQDASCKSENYIGNVRIKLSFPTIAQIMHQKINNNEDLSEV